MRRNLRSRRLAVFVAVMTLPLLAILGLVRLTAAQGNQPPALDLNGDASGANFATTFSEDEGPRAIVDTAGLRLTDPDSQTMALAKAILTNRPDGNLESLAADPGATGLTVKYRPESGELSLRGTATITAYQQALRTLTYVNLSQSPDITDRIVTIVVDDGGSLSQVVTSTIAINAVNDAPVLDNTGDMSLTPINEDDMNSPGNTVESIIKSAEQQGQDRITDVDDNPLEGIAVIDAGSANGRWQYSLAGTTTWLDFGTVSNNAAVLLSPAARIRFVPNPNFHGSVGITFRAWDQTQGQRGDRNVDVSVNGGTTAFSAASETAQLTVVSVNDLPQVDLNGPAPGVSYTGNFFEGGPPAPAAGPQTTVSDIDHTMLLRATVTLTNRPDGALEILAADTLTTAITLTPYDNATGRLTLNGPDLTENFQRVLRRLTYFNGSSSPTAVNRIIEVVVNDGANDSAVVTSTIKINPANSAPVLQPNGPMTLSDVAEDDANPPGNTVAEIIASPGSDAITDADPGALEGLAIIGADNAHGDWQYFIAVSNGGEGVWRSFGVVSDSAAVLLDTAALVRFVPAADYNGASGSLTFRAWDQTSGSNGDRGVVIAETGGASAFSAATASASLNVTAVNDPPQVTLTPAEPPTFVEGGGSVFPFGGGLTIVDVDHPQLAWATVTISARPDGDVETLSANAVGTAINWSYAAGVLRLDGLAPVATYQQVLRTVAYRNTSQDPDPVDRSLELIVSDGAAQSSPVTAPVRIRPQNDPPQLDLNGADPGADYDADFTIKWGPVVIVDANLSVVDVDNTSAYSATVRLLNPLDGIAEALSAQTAGTAISRSYDPETGELRLTGRDTIANYQQVLRTVTYNNVLPSPQRVDRIVEFRISDETSHSAKPRSTVRVRATPTVQWFLPVIAPQRTDEPNNVCAEAFPIGVNAEARFFADDRHDWYTFELNAPGTVTVELRDFAPAMGQIIVASGAGCGNLKLLGNNGDDLPNKNVPLGRQPAGRYFIWVINDGAANTTAPYRLNVRLLP